jgi:hypothetical protein
MRVAWQYSVAYLLAEMALIAIALAAGRVAHQPAVGSMERQAICYCIAMTAACGALGGICLRMAVGLIAGGVLAASSIPMLWMMVVG